MSTINRGGQTLTTGKIGKPNCIRQQILMPGEMMDISMTGKIRLESLRERDVMRINAHMATFMTPLRWVWPEFPDYLKQGPTTAITPPTETWLNFDQIGCGARRELTQGSVYKWFPDAYLRCLNEWYVWPENPDWTIQDVKDDTVVAVPLSKTWSRMRFNTDPSDSGDYTQPTTTDQFDVRDLQETLAKFRGAMKRDVLSFGRWMELVKETYGSRSDPSREIDQVPIMLDQTEIGVNPREIPATDGASLGQWQSLFDFGIDHQIRGVVAPEHCIITTILVIRFAPTVEGRHPLCAGGKLDWYEIVADPEYLASASPVDVNWDELFLGDEITGVKLGELPAGWQWRADHDVIGSYIDIRDSFPYSLVPNNQAETKDASRVKDAFRSQALEDYVVDCYVRESSRQPIGDSMDSYFAGMTDDVQTGVGGRNQEFPKGGKQL